MNHSPQHSVTPSYDHCELIMTSSSDLASVFFCAFSAKREMEDVGVTTANAIVVSILEHVGFYEHV